MDFEGIVETDWENTKEYMIKEKSHPNTKEGFSATWEACYDTDNLYFLIDITDDTNLQARKVKIDLEGTNYKSFKAVRSIDNIESYKEIGSFTVEDGSITYEAPSRSITTFTGIE